MKEKNKTSCHYITRLRIKIKIIELWLNNTSLTYIMCRHLLQRQIVFNHLKRHKLLFYSLKLKGFDEFFITEIWFFNKSSKAFVT